jgi:hypothetical protein
MYCPKCNQQQTSEEMRYCSRCGFPLTGVAQLLANNGLPLESISNQNTLAGSSRKKIISESAFLTLVAWAVAFAATLFVNFGGPLELVARVAATLFFILGLIGLIRFTYGFLFVKDSSRIAAQHETSERSISGQAARSALPPHQGVPLSDYPQRSHTKEIVPQASVTENTTRLLDEQITHPGE